MSLKPFDFDRLFASGAGCTGPDGQYLTVQVDEGWLALPTGRVIAVEPGISGVAFTQAVPPGRYPVLLSVAEYHASSNPDSEIIDERVAAARLVIRAEAVATWEPAVTAGQDVDDLGDGPRHLRGGLAPRRHEELRRPANRPYEGLRGTRPG
ncbi:MAG: hypothetical protein JWP48_6229, partial [Actinoallomurus sp.]|nr:hypothetical protein [Actinoallomurus sp.]